MKAETTKWQIGDILKVKQGSEIHYERVIQTTPEILTIDMNSDKDGDVSTQGLSDNLNYCVIENYEIANVLKNYLPRGIAFSITDRFFGSDYPMEHSTFENAVKDTGYKGY